MDPTVHKCSLCNVTTSLSIDKYKASFNVQQIQTFLVAPRVDERQGVYMDNIYMYAGEQRTVHVWVTAEPGVEFEIADPKYQIIYQDEIIDEGPVYGSKEPEPSEPEEPGGAEAPDTGTEEPGGAASQQPTGATRVDSSDAGPEEPVEPGPQPTPEPEEPEHDPHELIITMNPQEAGKYILTVDFWVANEHIIRQHNIYVRKTK